MKNEGKPTFKELLEKHDIDFHYFYENCLEVPTEEISIMYTSSICTRSGIAKMLIWVNNHAHTSYTTEDIYIAQMY